MKKTGLWMKILISLCIISVVAVLSFYFFYRLNPLITQLKITVDLVEYGLLEEVSEVEGLILRDETEYMIPDQGNIRWLVMDGQKIGRQQKLADIIVSDADQTLLLQQQLIQMRLDTILNGGDLSAYSNNVLIEIEQQMDYLMKDIRNNLQNEQYELAYQNQIMLNELSDQKKLMSAHQSLPEMTVEQLEAENIRIEDKLRMVSHEIRSQDPGFLALGTDGILQLTQQLAKISDDEQIRIVFDLLDNDEIPLDQSYYRIIREHRWHIILPIDRDLLKRYEAGQRVLLREQREQKEIRGVIKEVIIETNHEKALVKIELMDNLHDWHKKRKMNFGLIVERQEGLLVPASSVMKESEGSSVYKVDVNGYAIRMPVIELGRNEEVAVLREGPITVAPIDPEGTENQVQTIRHFDEIIVNPEDVVEGQKIR